MTNKEPKSAVHQDMIHRDLILREFRARQKFLKDNKLEYVPPEDDQECDRRVAMIPPQKYQFKPVILKDFDIKNIEEGLFTPDDYRKGTTAQK